MIITLTKSESDIFLKESNISTQEELDYSKRRILKNAADLIDLTLQKDGQLDISINDTFSTLLCTSFKPQITYLSKSSKSTLSMIKTGLEMTKDFRVQLNNVITQANMRCSSDTFSTTHNNTLEDMDEDFYKDIDDIDKYTYHPSAFNI